MTMLAEAGCAAPQIAAIASHSLRTVTGILDHCLARTRTLATSAITLFESANGTDSAYRLQTKAASGANGSAK